VSSDQFILQKIKRRHFFNTAMAGLFLADHSALFSSFEAQLCTNDLIGCRYDATECVPAGAALDWSGEKPSTCCAVPNG
jgi:hypothetical protein